MFAFEIHHLIHFSGSCIITMLGGLLLGVPIPAYDSRARSFRMARLYLALSFFILGFMGLLSCFVQVENGLRALASAFTLIIAYYQALLFTVATLLFIQPHAVTGKFICWQLSFVSCVCAAIFAAYFFGQKTLFVVVISVAAAIYLALLIYYTRLFRCKFSACLARLETHNNANELNCLRWMKNMFYTALVIGILALISLFMPLWFSNVFAAVITIFYAYVVNRFYCYRQVFKFLVAKPDDSDLQAENKRGCVLVNADAEAVLAENNRIEAVLQKWVDEKRFTQSDISVNEIARELGVCLPRLRCYFKSQKNTDFRTWRSELRIREAQAILKENPEMPLETVRSLVGFNHRANFHQQFQKITGTTPTLFKMQYLKDA